MSSPDALKSSAHALHRHDLVWNSGLVITNSAIHGRGVFVSRDFRAGSPITRLSGQLMRGSLALSDPDYIGIGPQCWIDPELPFSTINHSCEPTAAFGRRQTIHAVRDLSPGDEVTIDYSTTEEDPDWQMDCACGTTSCRGVLRAIQFAFPDPERPPLASPLMLAVWRRRLKRPAIPLLRA